MPRPTNFVAFIRNVVRDQVQEAIQGLLGAVGGPKEEGQEWAQTAQASRTRREAARAVPVYSGAPRSRRYSAISDRVMPLR